MIRLPEMPDSIAALPCDERGYPVPWFVAWVDGLPEFRVADGRKMSLAIRDKRCWVCGEVIESDPTFVIGPMCAINRVSSEPPGHLECALFSVKACPFLTKPKAVRRESNLPDGTCDAAGVGIMRNPGVSLCWTSAGYELRRVPNGVLFDIGDHTQLSWWAEGRPATRREVLDSIESGAPLLKQHCECKAARKEFNRAYKRAMKLVPR